MHQRESGALVVRVNFQIRLDFVMNPLLDTSWHMPIDVIVDETVDVTFNLQSSISLVYVLE